VTDKRHVSAAHSVRKESLVTLGWQAKRAHKRPGCVRKKSPLLSEVEFQTTDCPVLKLVTILAATPGPC